MKKCMGKLWEQTVNKEKNRLCVIFFFLFKHGTAVYCSVNIKFWDKSYVGNRVVAVGKMQMTVSLLYLSSNLLNTGDERREEASLIIKLHLEHGD